MQNKVKRLNQKEYLNSFQIINIMIQIKLWSKKCNQNIKINKSKRLINIQNQNLNKIAMN